MNIIRSIFRREEGPPQKVIVIGGGLGGLQAVRGLACAHADVTLVDKCANHVFQPLLFQVADSVLDPSMIATPFENLLKNQKNCSLTEATVVAVDTLAKRVILSDRKELSYDALIVAPGTRHSYFSHPDWEAHAPGLKTMDDALRIREKVSRAFERGELSLTKQEAIRELRFVIAGGGPTGVELAGSIAKMIALCKHKITPKEAEIYLIDPHPQILTSYPHALAAAGQKDLENMGVKLLLNRRVVSMARDQVTINDGEVIESPNLIWAAGNQAPQFLETLGVPRDSMGRVIVGPDLTIPNHPEVFVIGDASHFKEGNGTPLPGLAQVAMQQGSYAASLIQNRTPAAKRTPFKYSDRGSIAIIGRMKAVMRVGFLHISGFFAWLIWSVVHLFYVNGWGNRVSVLNCWMKWQPHRMKSFGTA